MNNSVECKNIGVDWIGSIPSNWKVSRFKHLFDEKKSTKNPELNSGSISFGQVIYKNDESIPESTKEGYQEVLEGEFLINPLNLNYDLKSLRIALSRINVVVSQGYIVLKLRDHLHPNYYEYLLRKFDVEHMKSLGQGVRQTISFTHLKDENLVVPPIEEQKLISRYLDKKTSQIDSLVEKIQKKIELLKEQRTSLINHYVTKGLDPNVEMKDSGVEWIGEIPKHWTIIKLSKLITSSQLGENYKTTNEKKIVPVLKMGNIGRGEIDLSKLEYLEDIEDLDSTKLLNEGDLLFNTRNSSELVGKVCLWDGTFPNTTFNSNILKITFSKKVSNKYMNYLFNSKSILDALRLTSKGTTNVSAIYFKDLSEIYFPIAPREEQVTIIKTLNDRLELIGNIIDSEERRVRLFLEYRQSLISSVVTGQVRVTEDMV